MGRTGHRPVLVLGAASLLVAAVGTSVALTRGDGPVAKAPTTLAAVRHAALVSPNGRAVAASSGQRVPNGDVIRTGRHGSAQLVTRGRVVYVGSSAAVAVTNGAVQQLRTGTAVVDAQHGPGLDVDIAGDRLTIPDGSAVTATRRVSVVVGSLAGASEITNASARRLAIPRLAQVAINGDALPTTTAPLHLNDGPVESRVVPALVDDDRQLKTLARGIDTSGASTAQVVAADWRGTQAAQPRGTSSSDRVLPMVIADATKAAGGSTQDRYRHVVTWRRAGGSWGVVVELLSGHATGVASALQALEHAQPSGLLGTGVRLHALAARPVPGAPRAPGTASGNNGPSGGPGPAPSSGPTGPTNPSGPGHPGGTPTPTPSGGTTGKVVGTVKTVVHKIVGLVPTKLPVPPPSKRPGGLLGGVLGR